MTKSMDDPINLSYKLLQFTEDIDEIIKIYNDNYSYLQHRNAKIHFMKVSMCNFHQALEFT